MMKKILLLLFVGVMLVSCGKKEVKTGVAGIEDHPGSLCPG